MCACSTTGAGSSATSADPTRRLRAGAARGGTRKLTDGGPAGLGRRFPAPSHERRGLAQVRRVEALPEDLVRLGDQPRAVRAERLLAVQGGEVHAHAQLEHTRVLAAGEGERLFELGRDSVRLSAAGT